MISYWFICQTASICSENASLRIVEMIECFQRNNNFILIQWKVMRLQFWLNIRLVYEIIRIKLETEREIHIHLNVMKYNHLISIEWFSSSITSELIGILHIFYYSLFQKYFPGILLEYNFVLMHIMTSNFKCRLRTVFKHWPSK